jgi:hypothetical protein
MPVAIPGIDPITTAARARENRIPDRVYIQVMFGDELNALVKMMCHSTGNQIIQSLVVSDGKNYSQNESGWLRKSTAHAFTGR